MRQGHMEKESMGSKDTMGQSVRAGTQGNRDLLGQGPWGVRAARPRPARGHRAPCTRLTLKDTFTL